MRALVLVLVLAILAPRVAGADQVDDDIKDLSSAKNEKVRLAAAASLRRSGDRRAIGAFVKTLRQDAEQRVRRVVAIGLAKVVTNASSAADHRSAVSALRRASKRDKDRTVRSYARKALGILQALTPSSTGTAYVSIGTVKVPAGSAGMVALLRKRTKASLIGQPALQFTSPGNGFQVDIDVGSIQQAHSTGTGTVKCRATLTLSTYPNARAFAVATGSAVASASGSGSSAADACAEAVVEHIMSSKVIPAMRSQLASQATKTTATTTSSSSSTSTSTP